MSLRISAGDASYSRAFEGSVDVDGSTIAFSGTLGYERFERKIRLPWIETTFFPGVLDSSHYPVTVKYARTNSDEPDILHAEYEISTEELCVYLATGQCPNPNEDAVAAKFIDEFALKIREQLPLKLREQLHFGLESLVKR